VLLNILIRSSFACILLLADSSCPQFPESLASAAGRIFSPLISGASTPPTTARGARDSTQNGLGRPFEVRISDCSNVYGIHIWLMLSWVLHFHSYDVLCCI
jgi:hypothetical protein